ncbi:hypothetical protein MAR_026741 [Mya arenaria]|uniref:Uncharacterized protein n=1 Tax=Mya arenaria TaxID=6604 RepID=A0ABY7EV12_MYAAR|nr:hypothetical protein MAR_026741 [Mya arenaria]
MSHSIILIWTDPMDTDLDTSSGQLRHFQLKRKRHQTRTPCEHFGLPDAEYVPENFPDHQNMSKEEIRLWLVSQIDPIVTSICSVSRGVMTRNDIEDNNTDDINSYGNVVI